MMYKDTVLVGKLRERLGSSFEDLSGALTQRYGGHHIARPGGPTAIARYVVHHTAGSPSCSAECLWRFFVQRRWARFNPRTGGYHACITPDGRLQMMIPPSHMSWGAGRRWNPTSVHVALCGNYTRADPTPEMLQTLYVWLCTCDDVLGYNVWRGHRELSQTTCPGDRVMPHLITMRGRTYGAAPDWGKPRPSEYP